MNKEMVYKNSLHAPELLAAGAYKHFLYAVTSMGSHPCAYVQIPESHPLYMAETDVIETSVVCHGGITYTGDRAVGLNDQIPDGFWIGWDYAHYGDYLGFAIGFSGRRWTTEEIEAECKAVIDQLDACI